MKKIYDGFTFFNEFDLLEIRLEELYDHVDVFVLVESDSTFTNIPKPYYFEENKERYSKYLDKIRHVKICSNKNQDPWQNEFHQRECIREGLYDAAENDVILISDVDEIPRPSAVDRIRNSDCDLYALYVQFFYYKLNYVWLSSDGYSPTILAARAPVLLDIGVQPLRDNRWCFLKPPYQIKEYKGEVIQHAGWHFTYIGDTEFIRQKFVSFSHASDHTPESVAAFQLSDAIAHNSESRTGVVVDEYFPESIRNNMEKYARYLLPEDRCTTRMSDHYNRP